MQIQYVIHGCRNIPFFAFYINFRICSVPSQIRAKIHLKSTSSMGFLPASLGSHTVSAASAQTY
ncbi:hypothetical protein CLOSTASPAR_06520 [[Clostridium] asparagiforme DSM 15981]|uniref:Uncharacterized protein n=1 Tax=[Clostridium] asparagiforme DSM 15981 TaxID=518636 RepID=C0DB64_9FIRM|nr:hypothetical protein CLOSTASPAR_06520 [[Clostridium] asparagiforme DSM 15981]